MLDCVVIGAGFAGLTAARELVRRGCDIALVEARDRVGGRVVSTTLDGGEVVDLGGQWIAPSHDRMLELVKDAGLELIDANPGMLTLVQHGEIRNVAQSDADADARTPFAVADLGQGLMRLRRLAERAGQDDVWVEANAAWLDQSIDRWIIANLRTPTGRRDIRAAMRAVFESPLDKIPLRQALGKVREGVDMENLIAANGDIGQARVLGGLAQLPERMAAEIGDRLSHRFVVDSIEQDDERVIVRPLFGEALEARTAILALPPWLATRIHAAPPLADWREDAVRRIGAGNVIKCYVVYETPWWRDKGLSGQMSADDGAVRVTFDVTDRPDGRGVLMGFFEGGEASMLTKFSKSMRQRVFKDTLVDVFGPQAAHPVEYIDIDWGAEEFTRGSHGAHFAPGVWSVTGAELGRPCGRIHFAGAEYATKFNGYMEGAVRSGAETAREVVLRLNETAG
ncbi:FAD-dependent oxidoreductase [uncultured Propionibacterium sp.]|uniref:flavin monoamine oxidase family protein n=1 Tax=uncultured Propionibacterium sp. TaxID=218066 RepID=UPI00292D9892|nr:FAD-dependent oxidoreductase [uncultured Propionibacterium sp.]